MVQSVFIEDSLSISEFLNHCCDGVIYDQCSPDNMRQYHFWWILNRQHQTIQFMVNAHQTIQDNTISDQCSPDNIWQYHLWSVLTSQYHTITFVTNAHQTIPARSSTCCRSCYQTFRVSQLCQIIWSIYCRGCLRLNIIFSTLCEGPGLLL